MSVVPLRTVELTDNQLAILLQLINQSNWKGDGVEIAVELKKLLTKPNAEGNQDKTT